MAPYVTGLEGQYKNILGNLRQSTKSSSDISKQIQKFRSDDIYMSQSYVEEHQVTLNIKKKIFFYNSITSDD